jgi:DnaK suppressor protein
MTDAVARIIHLRDLLVTRRHELQEDIQRRLLDRSSSERSEARDDVDRSDADASIDLEFSLMQMKTETMTRIDAALRRLESGEYGQCFACDDEISEQRLRALPFAVRCHACEAKRESGAATGLTRQPTRISRLSETAISR